MIFFSLDENALPEALVIRQIADTSVASDASAGKAFALHFKLAQVFLPGNPVVELLALIHVDIKADIQVIHLSIFPFATELVAVLKQLPGDLASIKQFAHQYQFPLLNVSAPWMLKPVYIPKPWGQEIWFTGIEARGQSAVKAEGGIIPLPWLLALFPQGRQQLILLKVLDPLPDEVYGDLYFELHEEKQEVYVVTAIDSCAWPDGVGAIQLGFSSKKRQEYTSDSEFKAAYLEAVQRYERVRRLLDAKLDDWYSSHGIQLGASLDVAQLKDGIKSLSQSYENKQLIEEEQVLREGMNCFVNHLPLRVGDTLAIPRLVPHALQHGVKVVEFQTPVYERKILSFAQKVLTQNHWDTEAALAITTIDHALDACPEVLLSGTQVRVERIVNFDDFTVQRVSLDSGTYEFGLSGYSLIMPIMGELSLSWGDSSLRVSTGDAVLVPESLGASCRFTTTKSCLFLHAWPQCFDKT